MMAAARESGVTLGAVSQRRFYEPVDAAQGGHRRR